MKVAGDILDYTYLFVADDRLTYDEAAFDKRIRQPSDAVGLLTRLREALVSVEPFDAPTLDKLLHDFVAAEGIQMGNIIHALRVAVTGQAVGFGLFETLAILGQVRCAVRIDAAIRFRSQRFSLSDQPCDACLRLECCRSFGEVCFASGCFDFGLQGFTQRDCLADEVDKPIRVKIHVGKGCEQGFADKYVHVVIVHSYLASLKCHP